ncbi:hypothetical protein CFN78_17090 [Amycolatopsis antarctica]|uniref:Cytochrome P450 n=1 Tax=Amycolatopsis antarctica TaxID=1854586 RepID=A0A263D120_9PSEU|nr:hypothetical protein CFN78_17090 [Amycolatopsis antarctica]
MDDPRSQVPPAPTGMEWLRACVSRFAGGGTHARRRALAVAELAAVEPASLRVAAAAETCRDLAVRVLADALGLPGVSTEDVRLIASVYHPGSGGGPAQDAAVARLVAACGGAPDERTAARICLLVQACDATAALIASTRERAGDAGDADAVLAAVLHDDPPVRHTRRVTAGGASVRVELGTVDGVSTAFGSGPRACPGKEHALAIAAGALDAARAR